MTDETARPLGKIMRENDSVDKATPPSADDGRRPASFAEFREVMEKAEAIQSGEFEAKPRPIELAQLVGYYASASAAIAPRT